MPNHRSMIRRAEDHLARVEPKLGELIARHGTCRLKPNPDVFGCLVRSVVAQMVSTKAAQSVAGRVVERCGGAMEPEALLRLKPEELRACGMSNTKAQAIRALSELFAADRNLGETIHAADDDGVRKILLPIRGVGPWTVQMLLIFGLVRPDVWPAADLGIQIAVQDLFRLRTRPDPKRLETISRSWAPYRTIAAWHLWRSRDTK